MASSPSKKDIIREAAERDLETFIRLVHPNRVLGKIHQEVIRWWTRDDAKPYQLLLMPRDHQKSALAGYRCAWDIVRNPAIRILYISATSNLATKQLYFVKNILTCDAVRFYWPELVNPEEAKREKWTETEISVDHPKRKDENVRDPTIFTAGLTTTITGLHADKQYLDDIVVYENAYTEEGREKTASQYSYLASIGGDQCVVGTRYDPRDLYGTMIDRRYQIFNDDGEVIGEEDLYEMRQYEVESRGDGTGEFLWPRQQRSDGKWFGFNKEILAQKKALYLDQTQFYAQYYNNPNSKDGSGIKSECFQYYDKQFLTRSNGQWYYRLKKLNVFAAVDFAYSTKKKADYSAIVVVGIDSDQNIYVLDIDRFKTDENSVYFDHILRMHQKWDFRKIRAEVTAAQATIVNDLKTNYIRKYGLALAVEDHRPNRHEGSKEERIRANLQPRYSNRQIWHYHGGNCQTLEDELLLERPPHDDIKDCLASVVEICIAPTIRRLEPTQAQIQFHPRFGGIV